MLKAFDRNPDQGMIVGKLVAGYGDLEFGLLECLTAALGGDMSMAGRIMFRARGEEQRILIADGVLRTRYGKAGLAAPYSEAIADLNWCRRIRNQYAHSHWTTGKNGLQFTDFDEAAKGNEPQMMLTLRDLDLNLLQEQEAYFDFVVNCLQHLHQEMLKVEGKSPTLKTKLPKKLQRPLLYNGGA
jgi:hypothetical protein